MERVQLTKRMEMKYMLCFGHPTCLRTAFDKSKTSGRVWFSISSVCAVFSVHVQTQELLFQECMPLDRGLGAREKALQCSVDAWLAALSVKSSLWEWSPPNPKHLGLLCQPEARDMPGTFVLQHKSLQQKGTECWTTA